MSNLAPRPEARPPADAFYMSHKVGLHRLLPPLLSGRVRLQLSLEAAARRQWNSIRKLAMSCKPYGAICVLEGRKLNPDV